MPNRTEARPAKAVLTYATGRLPLLRLFSTPLIDPTVAVLSAKVTESDRSCSQTGSADYLRQPTVVRPSL
jgi:hypothetical protein